MFSEQNLCKGSEILAIRKINKWTGKDAVFPAQPNNFQMNHRDCYLRLLHINVTAIGESRRSFGQGRGVCMSYVWFETFEKSQEVWRAISKNIQTPWQKRYFTVAKKNPWWFVPTTMQIGITTTFFEIIFYCSNLVSHSPESSEHWFTLRLWLERSWQPIQLYVVFWKPVTIIDYWNNYSDRKR